MSTPMNAMKRYGYKCSEFTTVSFKPYATVIGMEA
jgi:hypothetical protein